MCSIFYEHNAYLNMFKFFLTDKIRKKVAKKKKIMDVPDTKSLIRVFGNCALLSYK